MDIIIFSKDRAFQLYRSLETIQKHVSKINNIGWKHSIDVEEGIRMTYKELIDKHSLFK